jgi:hypothetical protein
MGSNTNRERLLNVELAASRRLGRKLQRLLWNNLKSDDPEKPGVEFLVSYLLFLSAERTLSSIRTLARARMVDDAFALVRVLVEKVINGEYIFLIGAEPALDFIRFHAFREWRDLEELREIVPELAPKYTVEIETNLKEAHGRAKIKTFPDGTQKARFGRGADWIEMGLSKRAKSVDEGLKARFSMRQSRSTQILYYTAYKKGAVYLHGTWASLARSIEIGGKSDVVDPDGYVEATLGIRVKDGDPGVAAKAVNAANLAAINLLLFLDRMFMRNANLKWVEEFKDQYVLDLKNARKT